MLQCNQSFEVGPRWKQSHNLGSESQGILSLQSLIPALSSPFYLLLFSPLLCTISMASKWSVELKVCTLEVCVEPASRWSQ